MTNDLVFPSPDFPGPPPFRFELPEGWRAVPSVAADAVIVGSEPDDGVHPNVVITSHKVPVAHDPAATLRSLVDRQLGRPEIIDRGEVTFAGPDGLACSVDFTRRVPTDGNGGARAGGIEGPDPISTSAPRRRRTVGQSLNLCYLPGDRVAHVLAATGTYAAGDAESRETVQSVIRSVEFDAG